MYTAQLPDRGTFVIRYPRGRGVLHDWRCDLSEIEVGTGRRLKEGSDVAVLSLGPVGNDVQKAIEELRMEWQNISVAHYDMRFLKPLDEQLLYEVGRNFRRIITVEDGSRIGGFGSAVLEWMADHNFHPAITRLGLPDKFVEHGSVDELHHIVGIDKEAIKNEILKQ